MKNILNIILILNGILISAQVGINTKTPKQTLDIEGTLRVANTKGTSTSTTPLSWDTEELDTNGNVIVDNNDGLISKGADTDDKPFKILTYEFILSKLGDDWLNGVNLNIPTDKYTMILLDYSLVDPYGSPIFMQLGLTDNGANVSPAFLDQNQYKSGMIVESHNFSNQSSGEDVVTADNKFLVTSSPMIFTYPHDKTWHVYADYPETAPAALRFKELTINNDDGNPDTNIYATTENGDSNNGIVLNKNKTYNWKIKFLLIKNSYIKALDKISIDLNADGFGANPKNTIPVVAIN